MYIILLHFIVIFPRHNTLKLMKLKGRLRKYNRTYTYDNAQETIAPVCKHKVSGFSIKSALLQERKTFRRS